MASFLDIASVGLSLVSTGVKFYSAWQGGQDAGSQYDAQAAASFIDARRALIDARQARDVAGEQAKVIRRSGAEYRSAARAGYGANGIDVSYGSAVDVQHDITKRADQDALSAILLGERQATALTDEANALTQQGGQYGTAGGNARSAGKLAAAGSAFAGAADIASKWYAAKP